MFNRSSTYILSNKSEDTTSDEGAKVLKDVRDKELRVGDIIGFPYRYNNKLLWRTGVIVSIDSDKGILRCIDQDELPFCILSAPDGSCLVKSLEVS